MIAYNVVKHNLNWEKIWPRITFKYINFQERDVIFKGGGSQVDFFWKNVSKIIND